jgi:GDP-4-dehydro-6-deoxy-D-mannose reductase
MTSILVTGATGFIGRHLIYALQSCANYHCLELSSGDVDVRREETWTALPAVDIVVHLAGRSSVPRSWESPSEFAAVNCVGGALALEYCRRHRAKFIYLSSYLYGDAGSTPVDEQAALIARNPYALTKYFVDRLCEMYCENYGIDTRIIRPFNVYGPHQNDSFLIMKIINEARALRRVSLTDLEPRRDYIYVADLVDAIIKVIEYKAGCRVFNIGAGRSYSVLEVVQTVQEILGYPVEVSSDKRRRPGEIMDSVADITLARRELEWSPKFTLKRGLRETIEKS